MTVGRCAVRLIRLGPETSQVGADVRAALTSWAPSDNVLGGIALLGVTPLGCPRAVEAVIVMPRGVVVVVGVDLPDPAVRLEAPLHEQWKADGWPLVREDGAVNPGEEALAAAGTVTAVLEAKRLEPIPVSTIVAVGPYVGQVVQSTGDLHQGVRVLHPDPKSLLVAARELAVADRPCSVDTARKLLAELVGNRVPMLMGEIAAEGFADAVTPDLATASTTLIPRITDRTVPPRRQKPSRRRRSLARDARRRLGLRSPRARWLPMALGLLAVLLIAGVAVLLGTTGGNAPATAAVAPSGPRALTVGGVSFTPEGSVQDSDCTSHAYGDVQVWLAAHPCTGLVRAVYQTTSGGRAAAVALAEVSFADQGSATAFSMVANTDGSGGVTDLVTDGTWHGGPTSFDNAAYTVIVQGTSVRLTEVVWLHGTSSPTDPALDRLAATSAGLPGNQ
jgi:hypothetical protein